MKVLIATPLFPPDIGGPATYSKLLAEELPKNGIAVEIAAFREVLCLPKIVRHAAYFLRCVAKGRDSDLIYAQDPVSVGLPALMAAKFLSKRFALKVVGDYAWEMYQSRNTKYITSDKTKRENIFVTPEDFQRGKYDFITEIRRKVERFVAMRAERVIVPSEYLKGIVLKWGVSSEKIQVIYNAFNFPSLPDKGTIRTELGITGRFVLSAGRLVPWKGMAALIKAFAVLAKESDDLLLCIAGDGPERGFLEKLVAKYQLETRIRFLGSIARGKLLRYLKAADVFVLNTGYEGFSHQLLEAAAVGTPIVTTAAGGNAEFLRIFSGLEVKYNDVSDLREKIAAALKRSFGNNPPPDSNADKFSDFSEEKMIELTVSALKLK